MNIDINPFKPNFRPFHPPVLIPFVVSDRMWEIRGPIIHINYKTPLRVIHAKSAGVTSEDSVNTNRELLDGSVSQFLRICPGWCCSECVWAPGCFWWPCWCDTWTRSPLASLSPESHSPCFLYPSPGTGFPSPTVRRLKVAHLLPCAGHVPGGASGFFWKRPSVGKGCGLLGAGCRGSAGRQQNWWVCQHRQVPRVELLVTQEESASVGLLHWQGYWEG